MLFWGLCFENAKEDRHINDETALNEMWCSSRQNLRLKSLEATPKIW